MREYRILLDAARHGKADILARRRSSLPLIFSFRAKEAS